MINNLYALTYENLMRKHSWSLCKKSSRPAILHGCLRKSAKKIKALFALAPSKKHMNTRDLGRQDPTASLQSHAAMEIPDSLGVVPITA